jgi:hypothetical protein
MADQFRSVTDPDTSTHPLYEKLTAGGAPVRYAVLVGYFGTPQAEATGYLRLWTDLGFQRYYRFTADQVLHTERVDPENRYGPTKVFVRMSEKSSDKLELVQQFDTTAFSAGSMLTGAITQRHLGAARAAAPLPGPHRPEKSLDAVACEVGSATSSSDSVDGGGDSLEVGSHSCQTGVRCC